MRLLERKENGDIILTEKLNDPFPPYAILSHTWGPDSDEVTFHDIINHTGKDKLGYFKIQYCGAQAALDKLQYFWVDTCCIDQSSSAEVSLAINSMFKWYRDAKKCYVYLSDVSGLKGYYDNQLRHSRWFTRGWTLQELIAPTSVEFYCSEWLRLGNKHEMADLICEITAVPMKALYGHPLSDFGVGEKKSWAKTRQTTIKEDEAYCLLGIFDVFLPLIYGEGEHAHERLQEAINKRSKGNGIHLSKSFRPTRHNTFPSLDNSSTSTNKSTLSSFSSVQSSTYNCSKPIERSRYSLIATEFFCPTCNWKLSRALQNETSFTLSDNSPMPFETMLQYFHHREDDKSLFRCSVCQDGTTMPRNEMRKHLEQHHTSADIWPGER